MSMLGIDDPRLLADPRVKQQFDQLTTECLLTPFDRELVRCVDATGRSRQCLAQFQLRQKRKEGSDRAEPDQGFGSPVRRW